jgi:hypothetical protein
MSNPTPPTPDQVLAMMRQKMGETPPPGRRSSWTWPRTCSWAPR